jgi:hypothetical protein
MVSALSLLQLNANDFQRPVRYNRIAFVFVKLKQRDRGARVFELCFSWKLSLKQGVRGKGKRAMYQNCARCQQRKGV